PTTLNSTVPPVLPSITTHRRLFLFANTLRERFFRLGAILSPITKRKAATMYLLLEDGRKKKRVLCVVGEATQKSSSYLGVVRLLFKEQVVTAEARTKIGVADRRVFDAWFQDKPQVFRDAQTAYAALIEKAHNSDVLSRDWEAAW